MDRYQTSWGRGDNVASLWVNDNKAFGISIQFLSWKICLWKISNHFSALENLKFNYMMSHYESRHLQTFITILHRYNIMFNVEFFFVCHLCRNKSRNCKKLTGTKGLKNLWQKCDYSFPIATILSVVKARFDHVQSAAKNFSHSPFAAAPHNKRCNSWIFVLQCPVVANGISSPLCGMNLKLVKTIICTQSVGAPAATLLQIICHTTTTWNSTAGLSTV